jgi:hypothetical protein
MTDRTLRVAVLGTGGIGALAINTLKDRPGHDLVGVGVHSPAKVGRDVGEILGGAPIGLKAVGGLDEILALKPDCIVYVKSSPDREAAAAPDFEQILRAGVNIVTSTTTRALFPPLFEPWRGRVEEAAQAGGATFYAAGIEPGFAADYLPIVLATQCSSIRKLHAAEILVYDDYPVAHALMDGMGFGLPLDSAPPLSRPGSIAHSWGINLNLIASAMGVKLDEIREEYEREPAPFTVGTACGTIKEGTCGAMRFRAIGVVDGREAIVVEHINRMHHDFAPAWPQGDGYYCWIEGDPDITNSMSLKLKDARQWGIPEGPGAGVLMSTAMRVVNAIPYVVDAPPGMQTMLSMPLTAPKQAFV